MVVASSARNRFSGLISRVTRDSVMAQVEIQAGPHRFVSLLSREAEDELGLEPGMLAVAAVKATNVSVEIPGAAEPGWTNRGPVVRSDLPRSLGKQTWSQEPGGTVVHPRQGGLPVK